MDPVDINLRPARISDLESIIHLLAEDSLASSRESSNSSRSQAYKFAFEDIEKDPNNEIILAILQNEIVGVLQLTLIPNLTYQGGRRAQIEGVRVAKQFRNMGIGKRLIKWAIMRAKQEKCRLLQLTTDKSRAATISFYKANAFQASHIGFKLKIDAAE